MINSKNMIQKLPNNVTIGEYTYIGNRTKLANVTIGKFCSIASDVKIGLGRHPTTEFISTYPAFYSKYNCGCLTSFTEYQKYEEFQNIIIENDVWIGENAIVLDGVKICNGAIVAAGAVVTKDVPAYSIVGGVPARIIKYRFSEEKISLLESFKWWNKPIKWIIINADFFSSDIFFQKIKNNDFNTNYLNIDENKYFLDKELDINNLKFSKLFNKFYTSIVNLNYQIVIYGNGTIGKTIQALIPDKIVGYVDIADKNNHPRNLINMKYDKIIISVLGREEEIIKYLVEDLKITRDKIITLEV